MSWSSLSDSGWGYKIAKTHRIPRIACDTINWTTAESINLEIKQRGGIVSTFEYWCDMVVAVTDVGREVVIEKPNITEDHHYDAAVPIEPVRTCYKR
jgi:hypothetical protein